MLGWEIVIFDADPEDLEDGELRRIGEIGCWMTGLGGTDWLDDLVREGLAVGLGGNGYPMTYTLPASTLRRRLIDGLPRPTGGAVVGSDYVLPAGWLGKLRIDIRRLAALPSNSVLTIEAWDQS